MKKYEMVNKYNHYIDKRNSYSAKIAENNLVVQSITTGLGQCQDVMNKLKQYGVDSVMLEMLYDRNYEMFNEYELQRIINKLDAISSHLETAKKGAQRNINHWDSEIKDYDDK